MRLLTAQSLSCSYLMCTEMVMKYCRFWVSGVWSVTSFQELLTLLPTHLKNTFLFESGGIQVTEVGNVAAARLRRKVRSILGIHCHISAGPQ